ncbi:MAG: serine--tRNA ligase [Azospirillaceae bacterium]
MLAASFIIDNLDAVRTNCANRGVAVDLDRFAALDAERRKLEHALGEANAEANRVAKEIPKAPDADTKQELIAKGKALRTERGKLEERLETVRAEVDEIRSAIPNMAHPDAPVGETDEENLEVARGATPIRDFGFPPKDHLDLAEALDLVDMEAGSRTAGHGFYFLKNQAVLLDMALQSYALRLLIGDGFTPYTTPDLARAEVLAGTGFVPRGPETQIYTIEDTDLGLIATSEITLAGLFADRILDGGDLPALVAGMSHCFRTEAGAHGRATRGLYRVHQFTKVEMFVVCRPEESDGLHQRLLDLEKAIFDGLGIPYRIVDTATGDLGASAYRKYDLEAWMPGRGDGGSFGEITSTSNCTDYQARRLGIRYRGPDGKVAGLAHTLNGTAVATSRALIALLENYQRADGGIDVPEALRPYCGFESIEPKGEPKG